jgi:hypothetical protein
VPAYRVLTQLPGFGVRLLDHPLVTAPTAEVAAQPNSGTHERFTTHIARFLHDQTSPDGAERHLDLPEMLASSARRSRGQLPGSNPVIWFALTMSFVIFAAVVTFVALSSMGKLDGVMGADGAREFSPQERPQEQRPQTQAPLARHAGGGRSASRLRS